MAIPKSKRSGGPKTAEGKLAVANNALKTGSYSSRAVLPGESEEDLKQLQGHSGRDLPEFSWEAIDKAAVLSTQVYQDVYIFAQGFYKTNILKAIF